MRSVSQIEDIARLLKGWAYDPYGNIFRASGDLVSRGSTAKGGYLIAHVGRYFLYHHHIIWFLHNGRWPKSELDHADRERTNNAPSNLREVTRSQNCVNKAPQGASGITGVRWLGKYGKWQVRICSSGISKSKLCSSLPEARCLRERWEKEIYEANRN